MASVTLGQIVLDQPLGRGGMGEVWLGHVRGDQRPVAVKVITSKKARKDEYLDGFRREVRAVAGLNHPGIIRVFDYGPIPAETAAQSSGRLVADSPYFAMEYASGGNLRRAVWPTRWRDLRQMLLDILDALAHAHARGIIHRDLKPENILVDRDDADGLDLRLTDFGIAHALEPDRDDELRKSLGSSTAGTPYYMPPEQSRSDWRDYGPWTDLYALGCVAYELSTGSPPFNADHPIKIAIQHLSESPSALHPRLPVPAGLQDWIFRLLEKQPEARFQCAADAARALLALQAPDESGEPEADSTPRDGDVASRTTLFGIEPPTQLVAGDGRDGQLTQSTEKLSSSAIEFAREKSRPDTLPPRHADAPPVPSSWHRADGARPTPLSGVGLGLFGLRTIPFVDRDGPRDVIWSALREVQRAHCTRVIAVGGEPGVGKSRLVEWMVQRAAELGAARCFKATHGPISGPSHGLNRMVANAFACVGMDPQEARDRVRHRLDVEFGGRSDTFVGVGIAPALADLAVSSYSDGTTRDNEPGGLRVSSRAERFEPIRYMLEIFCRERPAILWLDDVHWGRESVDFVNHLLDQEDRQQMPLLVLMTLQPDELEHAHEVAESVDACLAQPACTTIELDMLESADHLELVEHLIGLAPTLARRVCDATDGNPLFATQLVGDWIERGVLASTPTGFELEPGADDAFPPDIHALWQSRIDTVLAAVEGHDALEALELAAVSDSEVDEAEWREVCAGAKLEFPSAAIDALLAQGLMRTTETGWAYSHGMLVAALVRAAEAAGRAASHHRAWAEFLAPRVSRDAPNPAYRRAMHLLKAGALMEAVDALHVAGKAMMRISEYGVTERLTDTQAALFDELAFPESAPERGMNDALRSEVARMVGDYDRAESMALDVIERASEFGEPWRDARLEAQVDLASVYIQQGRHDDVIDLLEQLDDEFEELGRPLDRADALQRRGWTLVRMGEHDRALPLLERARQLCEDHDNERGVGWARFSLAGSHRQTGELRQAERLLSQAAENFEHSGDRQGQAECVNGIAEIHRQRGHLDQAERYYERAFAIWRSLGAASAQVARLNLALVALHREHFERARSLFAECIDHFTERARPGLELFARMGALACAAAMGETRAAESLLDRIDQLQQDISFVDTDLAEPALVAGEQFAGAGESELSVRALDIARDQFERLGRDERVEHIDSLLADVESGGTTR